MVDTYTTSDLARKVGRKVSWVNYRLKKNDMQHYTVRRTRNGQIAKVYDNEVLGRLQRLAEREPVITRRRAKAKAKKKAETSIVDVAKKEMLEEEREIRVRAVKILLKRIMGLDEVKREMDDMALRMQKVVAEIEKEPLGTESKVARKVVHEVFFDAAF